MRDIEYRNHCYSSTPQSGRDVERDADPLEKISSSVQPTNMENIPFKIILIKRRMPWQ